MTIDSKEINIEISIQNALFRIDAKRRVFEDFMARDDVSSDSSEGSTEQGPHPKSNDVLDLVFKPGLDAKLLKLITDLLRNDPKAFKKLRAMLKSKNTSSLQLKALVQMLTKLANAGYKVAKDVLLSALDDVSDEHANALRTMITRACEQMGSYAVLRQIDEASEKNSHASRIQPSPYC